MDEDIEYHAEIKFKGSIKKFEKMMEGIKKLMDDVGSGPLVINPIKDKLDIEFGKEGGWPIAPDLIFPEKMKEMIISKALKLKVNKDIYGGMRNPHLHMGDELLLMDHAKFKAIVGKITKELG